MIKIGFSGIPSTGKTVLARAVAGNLWRYTKYTKIELVSEYARTHIANYGLDTVADQLLILDKQLEKEELVASNTDVLITDSPIFLGFAYALLMRRMGNSKDRAVINALFERLSKLNEYYRYDAIFHINPSITYTDDGVRPVEHGQLAWRDSTETLIRSTYTIFPPKELIFVKATDLEERIKVVSDWFNDKNRSK